MFKFVALIAIIGFCAAAPLDSEVGAETRLQESDISPEGVYHFAYQTSNGIDVKSDGDANKVQGSVHYIAPGGETIEYSYTADADGFHPLGALLPTPPPIPESVVRALAYLQAHPQKEELSRKP